MFDADKTGVTRTKITPALFHLQMEVYQIACDWYKRQILATGVFVTRAVLDPYLEVWMFYDEDKFVTAVEHDEMENVLTRLLQKELDTDGVS